MNDINFGIAVIVAVAIAVAVAIIWMCHWTRSHAQRDPIRPLHTDVALLLLPLLLLPSPLWKTSFLTLQAAPLTQQMQKRETHDFMADFQGLNDRSGMSMNSTAPGLAEDLFSHLGTKDTTAQSHVAAQVTNTATVLSSDKALNSYTNGKPGLVDLNFGGAARTTSTNGAVSAAPLVQQANAEISSDLAGKVETQAHGPGGRPTSFTKRSSASVAGDSFAAPALLPPTQMSATGIVMASNSLGGPNLGVELRYQIWIPLATRHGSKESRRKLISTHSISSVNGAENMN